MRGGDKQSWMGWGEGGQCGGGVRGARKQRTHDDKSSSRLIYLACSRHYPGGETAN